MTITSTTAAAIASCAPPPPLACGSRPQGRLDARSARTTESLLRRSSLAVEEVEAAGEVAAERGVGVEAVSHRPPLGEARIHRREHVRRNARVLGEVHATTGFEHPLV